MSCFIYKFIFNFIFQMSFCLFNFVYTVIEYMHSFLSCASMSVEQGDSSPQCNLGIMNSEGECDPTDLIEVRRLLGIMNLKGESSITIDLGG